MKCFDCGKSISKDEWVVCWGSCESCLDAAYTDYLAQQDAEIERKKRFYRAEKV